MNKVERQAIKRVLSMTTNFIAAQPQETLIASVDGGLMTWGEIQEHLRAALTLMERQ